MLVCGGRLLVLDALLRFLIDRCVNRRPILTQQSEQFRGSCLDGVMRVCR